MVVGSVLSTSRCEFVVEKRRRYWREVVEGREGCFEREYIKGVFLMSFGGFLDNSSGGGARIVADIPYSNSNNMPTGAIAQPRLLSPSLAKSMFSSPGLSLALVRFISCISPFFLVDFRVSN